MYGQLTLITTIAYATCKIAQSDCCESNKRCVTSIMDSDSMRSIFPFYLSMKKHCLLHFVYARPRFSAFSLDCAIHGLVKFAPSLGYCCCTCCFHAALHCALRKYATVRASCALRKYATAEFFLSGNLLVFGSKASSVFLNSLGVFKFIRTDEFI
jgi:hypothetical protein